MRAFIHLNALSALEAVAALAKYAGKARLNAGGTDLFGVLKDEFLPHYPEAIVNIKTVAGLDYIREEQGWLRIGALTKLADLASSPLLRQRYAALAAAAHAVATPQIRNVATIGGNLCQDVRCGYYRYPRHIGGPIHCARKGNGPCLAVKGDNRQHAIMEGRRCFAACPSDTAIPLAALDAQLLVAGPEGERRIAVRDFYTPMGNQLSSDEMVVEIRLPKVPPATQQTFIKYTLRKPIDFALVSVAGCISIEDGHCTRARIALGAVAPGPFRAVAAEEFLQGKAINAETAALTAELALQGARPLSSNGYKVNIAKALIARAILGQSDSSLFMDNVPLPSLYEPTELSTFHRCGASAASMLVASGKQ